MNQRTIKRIKKDFRAWSGGFPPESGDQITVYIDYALETGIDRDQAKEMLWDWMNADDPDEDLPATQRKGPVSVWRRAG